MAKGKNNAKKGRKVPTQHRVSMYWIYDAIRTIQKNNVTAMRLKQAADDLNALYWDFHDERKTIIHALNRATARAVKQPDLEALFDTELVDRLFYNEVDWIWESMICDTDNGDYDLRGRSFRAIVCEENRSVMALAEDLGR